MSTYTDCINLASYNTEPCADREMGRVRHIAYMKKTATFANPSSAAEWDAKVASGDVTVIRDIRGNYDGGAAIEGAGFGDVINEQFGINHTLVYTDPRVNENIEFYNQLKRVSKNYLLFFVTETKVWSVLAPLYASPKMPVTDDLAQIVSLEVTLKWSYEDLPLPYDKPDGFFEEIV